MAIATCRESIEVGSLVRVGPAYRGGGFYAPDGNEGLYTVVGALIDGADFKLVRGDLPNAESHDWELITHASRLRVVRNNGAEVQS